MGAGTSTQPGPLYFTVLDEAIHDFGNKSGRYGKANTLITATTRRNGRIDTDQLTLEVQQRTP